MAQAADTGAEQQPAAEPQARPTRPSGTPSTTPSSTPSSTTPSSGARPIWLARIHVTLKPVVLDPQGDAVLTGLRQLGFGEVSGVRVGKYLEVALAAADQATAEASVTQMCARLLANPVIESYRFTVEAQG